jgi:hypothetical protein
VAVRGAGTRVGLLASVLIGPLAFLLNLQINYMLVDLVCQVQGKAGMHLVAAMCLSLTIGSGIVAWRAWHQAGPDFPGDEYGTIGHARFFAFWGLLSSSLFFFVILAQWIPIFILNPCQR